MKTLLNMTKDGCVEADWKPVLETLTMSQAAILPTTAEAHGRIRRFELFPRLTSHVRHKAKYLDMRLIDEQAFVFTTGDGKWAGPPARTLKEFCASLKWYPGNVLGGHANRGDFSNWIAGVFHDHLLASGIHKIEQRYRLGHERHLANSLVKAIHDRYEFSSTEEPTVPTTRPDAHHAREVTLRIAESGVPYDIPREVHASS